MLGGYHSALSGPTIEHERYRDLREGVIDRAIGTGGCALGGQLIAARERWAASWRLAAGGLGTYPELVSAVALDVL